MAPHNTAHLARLRARSTLMAQLRQFFWAQGFVEVDTPIAITAPAPEPAIEAIAVAICADDFARKRALPRFLQTSPELAMKRLLAMGLAPIFQVAAAFRDGDCSPLHAPEFRLLEWYRARTPLSALMHDCEQLMGTLAQTAAQLLPEGAARLRLPPPPWPRLTVDACFTRFAGFSVLQAPTADLMRQQVAAAGLHTTPDDTWDELFFRVFVDRIEPALKAMKTPVFVYDFPAPQAALARLSRTDPRVAERFELYAGGMELANAFGELTCSQEQRQRFEAARTLRAASAMRNYPLDERFLAALDDMPEAAGIALGIERLMMLLLGAQHIDDISFLPWRDC